MRILEDDPSDSIAELTVAVLSHALSTAFDGKLDHGKLKPVHPELLNSLDVTRIIKATTDATIKPSASSSLIFHGLELLSVATLHGANAFKAYPDATKLLIAGLSSKEWEQRCVCLQALIRLHALEAAADREALDPTKFMMAALNFPSHILDEMMDYGMMRSDTFLTTLCTREFQSAIMKALSDRDYYALGHTTAGNILRTEYSIAEGYFKYQDPTTGKWETEKHAPFKTWSDALPLCVKALRGRKKLSQDLDFADIIDIKYCIMRQRYDDAASVALKAIERNPNQGYWYYAISMAHDPVKGLKATKQGMKCSQLSPFVKYQLMQRAVDHAGNLGIEILQQIPDVGSQKWYEGIAFLYSAFEDAKVYMAEAPPDNRNMKNVLYWYILLMVTIKNLSPDLRELEPAKRKLEIANEIMNIVGSPPPLTKMRLTQQTVIKYYQESVEKFSEVIESAGLECSDDFVDPTSEESVNKMAAWLIKLDVEDSTLDSKVYKIGEESKVGGLEVRLVDVDGESLSLYR